MHMTFIIWYSRITVLLCAVWLSWLQIKTVLTHDVQVNCSDFTEMIRYHSGSPCEARRLLCPIGSTRQSCEIDRAMVSGRPCNNGIGYSTRTSSQNGQTLQTTVSNAFSRKKLYFEFDITEIAPKGPTDEYITIGSVNGLALKGGRWRIHRWLSAKLQ